MRSSKRGDRGGQNAGRRQHRRDDAQMRTLERTDVARDIDDLINGGRRLCGLVIMSASKF